MSEEEESAIDLLRKVSSKLRLPHHDHNSEQQLIQQILQHYKDQEKISEKTKAVLHRKSIIFPILELPDNAFLVIFKYLTLKEKLALRLVSKSFGAKAKLDLAVRKWKISVTEYNVRHIQYLLNNLKDPRNPKHFIFFDFSQFKNETVTQYLVDFIIEYQKHISGLKMSIDFNLQKVIQLSKIPNLQSLELSYYHWGNARYVAGKDFVCCNIPHNYYMNHAAYENKCSHIRDLIEKYRDTLKDLEVQGNWKLDFTKTLNLTTISVKRTACLSTIFTACDSNSLKTLKIQYTDEYKPEYFPVKVDRFPNLSHLHLADADPSWISLLTSIAPQIKILEAHGSVGDFDYKTVLQNMTSLEKLILDLRHYKFFDSSVTLPSLTSIQIESGYLSEKLFTINVPKLKVFTIKGNCVIKCNVDYITKGFENLKELYLDYLNFDENECTKQSVHEVLLTGSASTLERLVAKKVNFDFLSSRNCQFENLKSLDTYTRYISGVEHILSRSKNLEYLVLNREYLCSEFLDISDVFHKTREIKVTDGDFIKNIESTYVVDDSAKGILLRICILLNLPFDDSSSETEILNLLLQHMNNKENRNLRTLKKHVPSNDVFPLMELPDTIFRHILTFLTMRDKFSLRLVSKWFGLKAKMDPSLRKWRIKMTEDNYRQMQMILKIFLEEKDDVLKHFIFLDVSEIHRDRVERFFKRFLKDYEGHITGIKYPLDVDLGFLSSLKIDTLHRLVFTYSPVEKKLGKTQHAAQDTTCCKVPHNHMEHQTFVDKCGQIEHFIEKHVKSLREIEIQGNWILNIRETLHLNSLTLNSATCLNGIFKACDGRTLSELNFFKCQKFVNYYPVEIDHLINVTKLYASFSDQSWVWLIHHFAPHLKSLEVAGSATYFEKEKVFHKMMNLETLVLSTYDQRYFDTPVPICLPSLTKLIIRKGDISANLFSLDVPKLRSLIITRDSTLPRNAVKLGDGFRQLQELRMDFQSYSNPDYSRFVAHEFLIEANCGTLVRLSTQMCPFKFLAGSDVEFRKLRTLESVYYTPKYFSGIENIISRSKNLQHLTVLGDKLDADLIDISDVFTRVKKVKMKNIHITKTSLF